VLPSVTFAALEARAKELFGLHGALQFTYTDADGDVITVGNISVTCVHTPGHTPGSQCFLTAGCLISGDTLFLEGCGRTDLPGSNVGDMYDSLTTLASLPDDTVVLPGHQYSAPSAAHLSDVKEFNYVFKPRSKEQWMTMFGHD
jgi:glyoxylase-like metal-dependent hydrolase (beta-lactamase superfamily II)